MPVVKDIQGDFESCADILTSFKKSLGATEFYEKLGQKKIWHYTC
jgi:hypothetical protein